MQRAQQGDRQAYEALLTEVDALLRAFFRSRLRDAPRVEDVVQDTLLSIHQYRHTYDPQRAFRPWMYAIAKNRLLDSLRREKRRNEIEVSGADDVDAIGANDSTDEQRHASNSIRRALELLSSTQRAVIRMLKLEGHSVAEIAEQTGLSESSVKVTAHRGYKNLRKLLGGIHE